jgi:hypothetical protein
VQGREDGRDAEVMDEGDEGKMDGQRGEREKGTKMMWVWRRRTQETRRTQYDQRAM